MPSSASCRCLVRGCKAMRQPWCRARGGPSGASKPHESWHAVVPGSADPLSRRLARALTPEEDDSSQRRTIQRGVWLTPWEPERFPFPEETRMLTPKALAHLRRDLTRARQHLAWV